MCFVDIQKAFDSVRLVDIVRLLKKENIPCNLIKLIVNIYMNTRMKVKHNEQISQAITTGQGIRQGDSLSPILFNLVMKHILNNLSNKKGYYFGSYNINSICYADDTVLIAESEDDLQRLLFQFYKTCQSFNMRISTQKTKCITISKEPLRCKLAINEYLIEQVMEIQYLGVTITSDGRSIKEAKEQSIKANRIAGCLNHSIWQNQYLRKDTKVRIYKAVIRPVLSYAAETRADSKKNMPNDGSVGNAGVEKNYK